MDGDLEALASDSPPNPSEFVSVEESETASDTGGDRDILRNR